MGAGLGAPQWQTLADDARANLRPCCLHSGKALEPGGGGPGGGGGGGGGGGAVEPGPGFPPSSRWGAVSWKLAPPPKLAEVWSR